MTLSTLICCALLAGEIQLLDLEKIEIYSEPYFAVSDTGILGFLDFDERH